MKLKIIKPLSYVAISVITIALIVMQLKSNKAENQGKVELAKKKASYIPVKVIETSLSNSVEKIHSNGFLKAQTDLMVISETQGRIVKILKETGDYIKQGDVIAKVDDEIIKSKVQLAKANYEQMKLDLDRFKKLKDQNAVTQKQFEEVRLGLENAKSNLIIAQRQLEDTKIKSPVSGQINNDFIELGMFVSGGTKICEVVDISLLKVQVNISERDIIKLKEGTEAVVKTDLYSGQEFQGKVTSIAEKASEGNLFTIEIELPNSSDSKLKAGMFSEVEIKSQSEVERIYIPRSTIKGTLKDASVFIIENEIAYNHKIKIGQVYGDNIEVIEGLKEGVVIVTSGVINLDNKSNVKITN